MLRCAQMGWRRKPGTYSATGFSADAVEPIAVFAAPRSTRPMVLLAMAASLRHESSGSQSPPAERALVRRQRHQKSVYLACDACYSAAREQQQREHGVFRVQHLTQQGIIGSVESHVVQTRGRCAQLRITFIQRGNPRLHRRQHCWRDARRKCTARLR